MIFVTLDIMVMTVELLLEDYIDHCDPIPTTTTSTTTTITTTTVMTSTVPIQKCEALPVIEIGYWQCQDNVCIIKCQEDEIAHLTVAIQCLCTSQGHCTWLKIEPKWLSDFRRYYLLKTNVQTLSNKKFSNTLFC